MKKFLNIILLLIVIAGPGCQNLDQDKKSAKLYPGKIAIGMETWPGYIALIIARDKGYFQEAGLNVEIIRYINLGEISKDYMAGKLQGRANITFDAVNEHFNGLNHKAVLAIDYSNGSDAIVARTDIKTVKDFQGKKVGYEPDTLEEFFLSWALSENGLAMSDIVPIAAGPQDTPKLLKQGAIDIAVSHEPFISELLSSPDFHIAYSSAEAPGLIADILTFRTDFVDAYPETIQTIVDVYFKALKFYKEHPGEAHIMLAKEFGDTPDNIARQMKGITMLDEQDNETALTFAAGLQSLYGNMRQIANFVRHHRGIDIEKVNTDKIDKIIDPRFTKIKYE